VRRMALLRSGRRDDATIEVTTGDRFLDIELVDGSGRCADYVRLAPARPGLRTTGLTPDHRDTVASVCPLRVGRTVREIGNQPQLDGDYERRNVRSFRLHAHFAASSLERSLSLDANARESKHHSSAAWHRISRHHLAEYDLTGLTTSYASRLPEGLDCVRLRRSGSYSSRWCPRDPVPRRRRNDVRFAVHASRTSRSAPKTSMAAKLAGNVAGRNERFPP